MTALSNAEGRALLAGLKGKGSPKPGKPPPIKMPKGEKLPSVKPIPALQTQLDIGEVEKALDQIHFTTTNGAYVEMHPTHRIIISEGITFILKPLET